MHQNHYFLSHLADELHQKIRGYTVIEVFSQTKRELVIGLSKEAHKFYIKSHHGPAFSSLSFPASFARKKANTASLMPQLIGRQVTGCRVFENERAIGISFSNDYTLVFQQYGTRSNELVFHGNTVAGSFRRTKDSDMKLSSIDRKLEPQDDTFPPIQGFTKQLFNPEAENIHQFVAKLRSSRTFYIVSIQDRLRLSMLPFGEVLEEYESPIEALSSFFIRFIKEERFQKGKSAAEQQLKKQIARTANYISKTDKKLSSLDLGANHQQTGDLIMANLHRIQQGARSVVVTDFYTNQPHEIKLSPTLSAQKNAERYYRKAKNQAKEIAMLKSNLEQKRKQFQALSIQLEEIQHASTLKELRSIAPEPKKGVEQSISTPYLLREFMGFTIWVGKGARQNDEMLRLSHKEDLWLHVKDGAGSHVIIRRPGLSIPMTAITFAAELAAYHSKRKHDSLTPVIYTSRKYVRKKKGMAPGAVVVEREKVVLVEPVKH